MGFAHVLQARVASHHRGDASCDIDGIMLGNGSVFCQEWVFDGAWSLCDGFDIGRHSASRAHRACDEAREGPVWSRILHFGGNDGKSRDNHRVSGHGGISCRGGDSGNDIVWHSRNAHHRSTVEDSHPVGLQPDPDRRICVYYSLVGHVAGRARCSDISNSGGSVGDNHIFHAIFYQGVRSVLQLCGASSSRPTEFSA